MPGPVDPLSAPQVICPNCHGGNPPIARLCMWCGAALKPADAPSVPSPPPSPSPPRWVPTNERGLSPHPPPGFSAQDAAPHSARKISPWFIAAGGLVVLLLCAIVASLGRQGTTSQYTPNQSQAPTQDSRSAADLNNAPTLAPTPLLPQSTDTPLPTLDPVRAAAATQTVGASTAGKIPVGSGYFYSPETSHTVSNFYDAFTQFGGVASLGFPITEPFIEQNRSDGTWAWVQYFEKATLEYHPQLDEPNRLQLSNLGAARFAQKYPGEPPASKPVPGKETYTFAETNHTVQGAFLALWKEGGEVRRFGYPISESFEEISDADGKPYIVQYFERAVMEYHPELKAAQNVQLAALGTARHAALYPAGAPASASLPQPSPTINATATALAVANATSTALTAQREATSTALTAQREATSTAQTKAANAQATIKAREYESYKTTAPTGDFSASGGNVAISCRLEYQKCISSWCADSNSKFILVGVSVQNVGSGTVHVNPLNFTLVSTQGSTVSYDSNTFLLSDYLDAVDVRPNNYTSGWIAFLVNKNFIPGELVWEEIFGETVEVPIVTPRY